MHAPLRLLSRQLIENHIGMGLHTPHQCVADKGNSHAGTGDIVGCHLLIQLQQHIGPHTGMLAQLPGPHIGIVVRF